MCVILACEDSYPSWQTLQDAEMLNNDGGGIAWLDKNKNICFEKGLTASEIYDMIEKNKVSLPCVIHFRIASVGDVTKELCHPFIISEKSPIKLKGKLDKNSKGVLFHNGTVSEYEDILRESVMCSGVKMLKEDYSDSRVMAFVSALYGHEFLKLIKGWNKFCVLDKNGIQKYGSWTNIEKGVKASNDYFIDDYTEDLNFYKEADELNDPDTFEYGGYRRVKNDNGVISYEKINRQPIKPPYNPMEIDSEIDGSKQIENDDDALCKLFDKHTKTELENKIKSGITNMTNPYLKNTEQEKIDESNIKYLKHVGWKNPEKLNSVQLQKAVKNEQKIQSAKWKFKTGNKNQITSEEYEALYEQNESWIERLNGNHTT